MPKSSIMDILKSSIRTRFRIVLLGRWLKSLGYGSPSNFENQDLLPRSVYFEKDSLENPILRLHFGYLRDTGWIRSRKERLSVDKDGDFIPWLTYPAIGFLRSLNLREAKVLEFGAGASSIYFLNRESLVTSIEEDSEWISKLERLDKNGRLNLIHFSSTTDVTLDDKISKSSRYALPEFNSLAKLDYENCFCQMFSHGHNFWSIFCEKIGLQKLIEQADVILVDGGPRNLFMGLISKFAHDQSVIIVDNSDSPAYAPGIQEMIDSGFRQIPFWGHGPMNTWSWETSIFIRSLEAIDRLSSR